MTETFIVSSDNDNLMIIRSTNMKSSFLIVFHRSIIDKVFATFSVSLSTNDTIKGKSLPFSVLIAVTKNILIKSKHQSITFVMKFSIQWEIKQGLSINPMHSGTKNKKNPALMTQPDRLFLKLLTRVSLNDETELKN